MVRYLKTTSTVLATIAIFTSALPAHADTYNDDVGPLFEYFNNQKKNQGSEGIVLERTKGRDKKSSSTLSLFGKGVDPLPDSYSRSNYRSRDWAKEEPTTILNLRVEF